MKETEHEMKNKTEYEAVDWLLSNSATLVDDEINTIAHWQRLLKPRLSAWPEAIDRAIIAGFFSDRLAYAFLSGYENALQKHFKVLPEQSLAAFCVSEKDGSRPRAMKTFLTRDKNTKDYVLNGQKSFVTCAEEAECLIIAAVLSENENTKGQDTERPSSEKPRIKLAIIKANTPGLSVTGSPDLPFIPEIKKGSLTLNNVKVNPQNILPGDGYSAYIKPFSCIEGVYILAASAAHLFRLACLFKWPNALREQILSILFSAKQLEQGDMCSPAAEIIISGVKAQLKVITETSKPLWAAMPEQHQQRLRRDCGMFFMSDKAHLVRLERAWQHYH